jgi:hypothetical protein
MAARPLLTSDTLAVVSTLANGEWAGIGEIAVRAEVPLADLVSILARLEFWGWLEQKTVYAEGTPISGARLRPSRLSDAKSALNLAPESVVDRDVLVGWLGSQSSTFVAGVRDFLVREPESAEPTR